ncbi:acetyltransferase GNAT Family protein [Streptococcus varani]|uniref:Acetyltransferase GNAT Family protein n=1 Tax=Streptococcus varani TaxID=1608583 RepID=A0A0E4H468_9STRE|nr:GNAT family N-acetyltransferase [Streptococcus varani]CQR24638.1 acetyltransferase GNAT Family protein [Streptococcus varani]
MISQRMSSLGRNIYLSMIPDYITGYVDYVFQTDKPDIQARRIKNLDKNFRRLLTEPYFWIQPMSQHSAEVIANWHYPAPCDFYDMQADPEDFEKLLSETARENTYFEVIRNGALFGFACFYPKGQYLEIGLGMKPDQTGVGLGQDFYQTIEDFALSRFESQILTLSVATFNKRALALYQKVGYVAEEYYDQTTNGGQYPFVRLMKNRKKESEYVNET